MPKRCRSDGHGDYEPGCPLCALALTREGYARKWGEPWPPPQVSGVGIQDSGKTKTPGKGKNPAPVRALPCVFEGAIVEYCPTCRGEAKHVRQCFHPSGVRDLCTRDNPRSTHQRCSTCPDYQPA